MPSAGEDQRPQEGRIVTFYSFKGGTGRTMALANVAWILAANGNRVLIADWDLESPGLHRFFQPFMEAQVSDRPGIIDFIRRYAWTAVEAEIDPDALHQGSEEFEASREAARDAITAMIDDHIGRVKDYAIPLNWQFPEPGALYYLSPGKQTNGDYEATLSALDWDNFYDNLHGALFFDALRALMKREYDYVLIDSRTGLSDIADICTVHLPDIVVDCFTLSTQGIEGAATVAEAIQDHNERPIYIFPVPMRIDRTQIQKVEDSMVFAVGKFKELPAGMSQEERREYWTAVEVPYQPSYAYEEMLAVFGDKPGSPHSLLSSYERIVARITGGAVTTFPPREEWLRLRTRLLFSRTPSSSPPEVVLDFSPEDQLWAEWIAAVLGSGGIRVRWLGEAPAGPEDSGAEIQDVAIVSESYISRIRDVAPAMHHDVLIALTDAPLPSELTETAGLRIIELVGLSETQAVDRLIEGLHGQRLADLESETGALRYPGRNRRQVLNIPARNVNFTGRDDLLRELYGELRSRRGAAMVPVAIEGLSGLGKTQVALEYAHRFRLDYDVIWWMNCAQSQYIDASLVDLANEMRKTFQANLPEGNGPDVARYLLQYLSEGQTDLRWLLVYDNAEDIDTMSPLMPSPWGHVLITCRDDRWAGVASSRQVGRFAREESVSHLRRRVPEITEAEADEVAGILGHIPLAIAAAGALMANTGISVPEYLQQLNEQPVLSLPAGHQLGDYPVTAVKAWCLSLNQLKKNSAPAARLLEICSVMAPDISLDLINSQAMADTLRALDPAISDRAMISGLIRQIDLLAMIKLDNNARQVQVHRVVQAVVNERMEEQEKATARRGIHRVLVAARPEGEVDDPVTWPRYRLIWPHLRASGVMTSTEEPVRQFMIERVRYLRERSDQPRARTRAEEVKNAWEAMLAKEPEMPGLQQQLFRLQFNLANVLRDLALFPEARAVDEAVMAGQRQTLGDAHPYTLATRSGLAADLRALGNYQAALKLDLETYEFWDKTYGDEYRWTLSAANNLALSYLLTGDFRQALVRDRRTLDGRAIVLGPTHPSTLNSGLAVARDLLAAGRYAEAVTRMGDVVAQCHTALGDDDRITLNARRWLGVALRCAGRPEQATDHFDSAMTGLTRGWGEDGSEALGCRLSQALNLLAMQRLPEGRAAAEDVLAVYKGRLGTEHPHFLICTLDIAAASCLGEEYPTAEAAARTAAEGLHVRLGPAHPYTLAAKMVLASTRAFQKQLVEAQELERAVTDESERILGPQHPDTVRCRANLVLTRNALGAEEGATERQAVIADLDGILGPDHPDVRAVIKGERLLFVVDPQPL
jgi:MinD-like ATPase involved in chromosome partitioning or flagellar assembly/tetratricopeptide (TPR) repeat protein